MSNRTPVKPAIKRQENFNHKNLTVKSGLKTKPNKVYTFVSTDEYRKIHGIIFEDSSNEMEAEEQPIKTHQSFTQPKQREALAQQGLQDFNKILEQQHIQLDIDRLEKEYPHLYIKKKYNF